LPDRAARGPVADRNPEVTRDHRARKLWLRMLACSGLIERRLRRQLANRFATTLPRFDLLAQLEREDGLTMSEASRRLRVTGGNVTGVADQLERARWLRREPVSDDRRATRLRLTATGRERFTVMAREHERWVIAMFDGLDGDEQAELSRLLGKLGSGLEARPLDDARPQAASPAPEARAGRR
jgi:DNA-binding MarR family transcriptional regulator